VRDYIILVVMDDIEKIYIIAKERECSEYDVFVKAGKIWGIDDIDYYFKNYLLRDIVPYFVRDYIRKVLLDG